jgi:hypothetical protein
MRANVLMVQANTARIAAGQGIPEPANQELRPSIHAAGLRDICFGPDSLPTIKSSRSPSAVNRSYSGSLRHSFPYAPSTCITSSGGYAPRAVPQMTSKSGDIGRTSSPPRDDGDDVSDVESFSRTRPDDDYDGGTDTPELQELNSIQSPPAIAIGNGGADIPEASTPPEHLSIQVSCTDIWHTSD